MKLYITKTSGNAWKVRLLLSMLKVPFETVVLDSDKKENKTPATTRANARHQRDTWPERRSSDRRNSGVA